MQRNVRVGQFDYSVSSDDDYLKNIGDEFEPHTVALLSSLVEQTDVVADVGANIGLTSLLFSRIAAKVYAFEPSPSTYKFLQENVAGNKLTNIETFNVGLGSISSTATITYAANNRSGGFVSEKIRPDGGHVTENVAIRALDEIPLPAGALPTFLKIDVEGFELEVIRGAQRLFAANNPCVALEMNHFCLNVLQRVSLPDFIGELRRAFPILYAVEADNSRIVDLHDLDAAYGVMHSHTVEHRFPTVVGAYSPHVVKKLERVVTSSSRGSVSLDSISPPVVEMLSAGLSEVEWSAALDLAASERDWWRQQFTRLRARRSVRLALWSVNILCRLKVSKRLKLRRDAP